MLPSRPGRLDVTGERVAPVCRRRLQRQLGAARPAPSQASCPRRGPTQLLAPGEGRAGGGEGLAPCALGTLSPPPAARAPTCRCSTGRAGARGLLPRIFRGAGWASGDAWAGALPQSRGRGGGGSVPRKLRLGARGSPRQRPRAGRGAGFTSGDQGAVGAALGGATPLPAGLCLGGRGGRARGIAVPARGRAGRTWTAPGFEGAGCARLPPCQAAARGLRAGGGGRRGSESHFPF